MKYMGNGHKIFVSYKYADNNVKNISGHIWPADTVRTYVDELEKYISDTSDHIYKGEADGEDLSNLSDETIWSKLKDRIYDSTLTIVMISPDMKVSYLPDRDQWIPWEISFSLKETSRKTTKGLSVTSHSNAMLAIVLPDRQGDYSYYTYQKSCCGTGCRFLKTNTLFKIMRENMFNIKNPDTKTCSDSSTVYSGDCSYITSVKWEDFIKNPESYIQKAYDIQDNITAYNIKKEV